MFIRMVDEALEKLLRARLPLPTEVGDVTFDAPSSTWSAQLSRLTINLFLYNVARSNRPSAPPAQRVDDNGHRERRQPQPMIQLSYLVSAWAGSPRDEHQLLGDTISLLAALQTMPEQHANPALSSTVHLSIDEDQSNRVREIWGAVGGSLKASFTLHASVAADSFDWEAAAPPVERVSALLSPIPQPAALTTTHHPAVDNSASMRDDLKLT